jgi:hypothetical protein
VLSFDHHKLCCSHARGDPPAGSPCVRLLGSHVVNVKSCPTSVSRFRWHERSRQLGRCELRRRPNFPHRTLESVTSEYRECALQLLDVLRAVDEFMCVCRSGRPPRKWLAASLALGLASTRGKTETAIALEWGVTRPSISKDVVAVLRLAHLEDNSAWGLKSAENRETYTVAGLTLWRALIH